MSYHQRFFAEDPDPKGWDKDGNYIGSRFYALVNVEKRNAKGKLLGTHFHALLTDEQAAAMDKAASLTDREIDDAAKTDAADFDGKTKPALAALTATRDDARKALRCKDRVPNMRADNGDLLHVFAGCSAKKVDYDETEVRDAVR